MRSFIPRQSGFSGAKASEALFKFGDLILERRFLRAHDGKPLVARNDAAPLKPHVVLDALYGQAAFAQCVDEAKLRGIRMGERPHAASVACKPWKESAFVVVSYGERRNARQIDNLGVRTFFRTA